MNHKSNPLQLTGFGLKYIAMFAMTLDHIGAVFLPYHTPLYTLFRGIGRVAFPIFCYLLVEGYLHTSNRRAYFKRLLIFALISELPFDMALFHFPSITSSDVLFSHQNVFFTLALAFLAMYLLDKFWLTNQGMGFACLIVICLVAEMFHFDYGLSGIVVIIIFFVCKKFRPEIKPVWAAVLACLPVMYTTSIVGLCPLLCIPFLLLYNGQKGSALPGGGSFPGAKYLFYAYYPVHLVVLGILAQAL